MTVVWCVLLGLLIGAVLGGLGGGGAILTVPALVYIIGQPAQDATTSSLVIVGLTAATGVLSYRSAGQVRWRLALVIGLVGVPATWLGSLLNAQADENLILLGFSVLMVLAAAGMLRDQRAAKSDDHAPASRQPEARSATSPAGRGTVLERSRTAATSETRLETTGRSTAAVPVVVTALAVGLLTGFFGVGGGFVIVPALVLALGVPMQQAIGTSLLIIAFNSVTSLAARASSAHFDWEVIVPFTLAAMVATSVGKRVADRLPDRQLKVGFAALLILVAAYTGWQSASGMFASGTAPAAESAAASSSTSPTVATPQDVEDAVRDGATLIDVRTPDEFAAGHLEGSQNIDLSASDFAERVGDLDPATDYVVYCASGNRAGIAIEQMRSAGFTSLINGGGFDALAHETSLPATTVTP